MVEEATETPKAPIATGKVLIVEDDPLLSDLLARRFTEEQISMLHVPTGERALEALQSDSDIKLILLDIRLPGIDGFEVLEKAKTDEKTKHIPVVILSNFGQDEDIEKGTKLGAEEFIVKVSLTLDEVVAKARTYLK